MGFWQTGYQEFHEEQGLTGVPIGPPRPPEFVCTKCKNVFKNVTEFQTHEFEMHPSLEPRLFIRGEVLGIDRIVSSKLSIKDITFLNCKKITLNNNSVNETSAKRTLSLAEFEDFQIDLYGESSTQNHILKFKIPNSDDLDGINKCLKNMIQARKLDLDAIMLFIENSKKYTSAEGFYDGIANYLYGVMAKERRSQVGDGIDYKEKFNQSLASLSSYNTLASSVIIGLIEFNLNHIPEAASRGCGTRYSKAGHIMSAWLCDEPPISIDYPGSIDNLFIDDFTHKICDWVIRFDKLTKPDIVTMTDNLASGFWTEYDKTKIRIILAEYYLSAGKIDKAREFVRYVSTFEDWRKKFTRNTHL